jgi:hypothetical protein
MRVNEAVALASVGFRKPLELSGFLIVSSHLVCIVEDENTARSDLPHFGVLVNKAAIEALNAIDVPLRAGSSVSLVGDISLKGTATHTGIPSLPIYVPYVYEFTFSMKGAGSWSFHIGEPFKNVYLVVVGSLSASVLVALKPLFDPSIPVIQLKHRLESQRDHLVGEHVRGHELARLIATIQAAGLQYRVEECEIARGIP